MQYKISYQNPTSQYIPIEAIMDVSEQDEVILQFPVWRPGRYERGDFVKNIHGFQVLDENNKKCDFLKITKDSWKVNCKGISKLQITYKYFADQLNAGSTYMDEVQLYVNPVNCLIYKVINTDNICSLTLDIPANFEIAAGANFVNNKIEFEDYHALVDTPFIASSKMIHLSFEMHQTTFHLWFQGEVKIDEERILYDVKKYTEAQIQNFGKFPVTDYHYLYQILPYRTYHGVEHQTSTVIALGPTYDLMGLIYDDFLGVSSHELYHTWNVKAIRPVEMFPYDYSSENYTRLGYVTEGVTTYMGDLYLISSGVKDWPWYKLELEKLMQRHFDNFGRFNYSVAESSFDTWLDGYVPGVPNRKVSIYNEGSLLSFMMDSLIRTKSNNKHSLHDVMRDLYQDFALANKGYSEQDFQGLIEKYSNENLSDLFENYYFGTHSFETVLTTALEQVGLEIIMQPNPLHAASILGLVCLEDDGRTLVKKVYPGGSADLAGIMLEDEIVAVNSFKLNRDVNRWVEFYKDDQIGLQVNRKGRILDLVCPNTNKSYFPIYQLAKCKAPSNLQKRIFKSWCGVNWDEI